MLYDFAGNEIDESQSKKPTTERLIEWERIDRMQSDASRALTPQKLDLMFREANDGDPESQARLSMEIEEKDWDTSQALNTRRAALEGVEWRVEPGIKDNDQAIKIAEAANDMLRQELPPDAEADEVDFDGAVRHMLTAILPGYAWLEIIWQPGGKGVAGYVPGETSAVRFADNREPLLVTSTDSVGKPLVPNKFIFHKHSARSGDPTRGGLIRPLGWMYLFANLGIKDLMRFTEKFGMPFISARIDDNAWEKDRTKIAYLIRNFGSDGGAVFSKAVELEMLQASDTDGEIYFKLANYMGDAKTKVILGQTATSGDAGGFSNGQAQSEVRQDILEADDKSISKTVRNDILMPWTMFNYGPNAPVPIFKFNTEPAEDLSAFAVAAGQLANAGYQIDPEFVETKTGFPLTKGPDGKAMISTPQNLFKYHLDYGIPTKNEVRSRIGLPPQADGDKPATIQEVSAALRGEVDFFAMADDEKKNKSSRQHSKRMNRW